MHSKIVAVSGKPLSEAGKAIIMLHGRGASAEDILSISDYLNLDDFAILAPRATNNRWYPYTFLSPQKKNEPWLTSALDLISGILDDLKQKKIESKNIYFLGFSQGTCLALEYTARYAKKYGGIIAFSGGLIGDKVNKNSYTGDFDKTPVFIGTSDPDPHIPVERVHETYEIFKNMNADITLKIYNNMGHTISMEEIETVNSLILNKINV